MERVERAEVAFEWASHRSRYAGAALHGFLQRIAREGLDSVGRNGVRSRGETYRAVLANLGVPPGDLAWAAERVESGLLRTLRDPRGRWVLENHADAASELADRRLDGGQFVRSGDRSDFYRRTRRPLDYRLQNQRA